MALEEISQPQRERLFHIDFRAEFLGSVNRAHLMGRFGLKEAAATRDLALYRSLREQNLSLDQPTKTYQRMDAFVPLFEHEPHQTLTALAEGFGDDAVGLVGGHIPTELPLRLNPPNIDILAAVSRAIAQRVKLAVDYHSLASGRARRTIVPLALVDSGARWHIRAFDKRRARYGDFVLTRIEKIHGIEGPDVACLDGDDEWRQKVKLVLVPHPGLRHPGAVARDYAMEDGCLTMVMRAALLGYALLHWSVDATPDHSLDPARHHLWLANAAKLDAVEGLSIAPGRGMG